MSGLSPILAYIGLGLSLFFGIAAAVAVIVVACLWWKHRNDKEPIDVIAEELQDISKRLPELHITEKHKEIGEEKVKDKDDGNNQD